MLTLSGCADGEPTPGGTDAPPPTPTAEAFTVDWLQQETPVRLGGGWSVKSCEGDAPLLCFSFQGEVAGVVELSEFPISSLPEFSAALADGSLEDAITEFAVAYYRDIRRDRERGCPDGYIFESRPPERVLVGEDTGVKMSFTGRLADGSASELTIAYAAVQEESLFIVNAAAYDLGGCLAPEAEFTSSTQLLDLEPFLDALVAGSPLPRPGSIGAA